MITEGASCLWGIMIAWNAYLSFIGVLIKMYVIQGIHLANAVDFIQIKMSV